MAWSRSILLKSAVLGSVVNLLIPLALAELTRLENVAIWLGARAGVQLLVALLPSPVHALLHAQGGEMAEDEVRQISSAAPLYLGSIALLVVIATAAILQLSPEVAGDEPGLELILPVFAGILFLSFASYNVLRVVQRGDLMLSQAALEFFLSLLCLPFLIWGFGPFLLAASAKELVKLTRIMPHFGRPALRLPPLRPMLAGRSQYLRGLTQVASQYLERTAYPLIFGLKVAGQLGLGSTIGVLPVMLSSNMYLWAFPRIANRDEDAREAVIVEWSRLLLVAAAICWAMAALSGVMDLGHYGAPSVGLAATFTATMGVTFLATARSRAALLGLSSSLTHLTALLAVYGAVASAHALGASAATALIAGMAVSAGYTLVLAAQMRNRCSAMLAWHALVGLLAAGAYLGYVVGTTSWSSAVCAIVAALLVTPYGLALLRSRLG